MPTNAELLTYPSFPDASSKDLFRGPVMLASIGRDGKVRLLSGNWEALLGHDLKGIAARSFCEIIPLERGSAQALLDLLLDPEDQRPVEFGIRANGTVRRVLWHRRFDAENQRMYIAAEEIGGGAEERADHPAAP
jgi:hypothetical protein